MPAVMIQGTGSNVGKSLLVAGLCRAARNRGLKVAPFKPQNMSNNAAVAGRRRSKSAAPRRFRRRACGVEPVTVDMNPVLLKPQSDVGAQLIVQGRRFMRRPLRRARLCQTLKPDLLPRCAGKSFDRLEGGTADIVAGRRRGQRRRKSICARATSPIWVSRPPAGVPVVLVGDIDRGGVIAQIVGTKSVLDADDARQIGGFIVNRFRGDPSLFDDGYRFIEQRSGWSGFGVLPYFADAAKLPAEDALDLRQSPKRGGLRVAGLALSRIANFDDFDPLAAEPGVTFTLVRPGEVIPGDADLVIIPGSKSTRGDLAFLRQKGWDIDIQAHVRRGGHVLGICGGYQMLGKMVCDPLGIEGPAGETAGLGLLDVATTMKADKTVRRVEGAHAVSGCPFQGYEIHLGRSEGPDCARPFAHVDGKPEGACSQDGRVSGSYLHGLFVDDGFRAAFLERLGVAASGVSYGAEVEATLDDLARHMETHLDVDGLIGLAR